LATTIHKFLKQTSKYAELSEQITQHAPLNTKNSDSSKNTKATLTGYNAIECSGLTPTAFANLVFCRACDSFIPAKNTNQPALAAPLIIITPNILLAQNLASDIKHFANMPQATSAEKSIANMVHVLPSRELVFFDIDARSNETTIQRISTFYQAVINPNQIFIAPASAIIAPAAEVDIFRDNTMSFKTNATINIDDLAKKFVNLGYVRKEIVEGGGQFSIRGGIIDFANNAKTGVRIELWGDDIESIRQFDIITQRSNKTLAKAIALPIHENFITNSAKDAIKEKIEPYVKEGNSHALKDYDMLESDDYFTSIDKYLPLIYTKTPNFFDYFEPELNNNIKSRPQCYLYESTQVHNTATALIEQITDNVLNAQDKHLMPHLGTQYFNDFLIPSTCIQIDEEYSINSADSPTSIAFNTRATTSFVNNIELFKKEVNSYIDRNYNIYLVSANKQAAENHLKELDIWGVKVIEGTLPNGLEVADKSNAVKQVIFGSSDVFATAAKPKKTHKGNKKDRQKLNSYADLDIGDYVVHEYHGIGKFIGIKQITIDDSTIDYLHIQYRGTDKLYVPTNQLDLVYKYIGKDADAAVKLNRLGGAEWSKTKSRVKRACMDMAIDLAKLYAKREAIEGKAFSEDNTYQQEFEDTFPYTETDGQLQAIGDTKRDMQKPKPMDRLICGDVGYGKTEVAMRASFKAVLDGCQVAYLVPTTVLASQHFNTFVKRMDSFGVRIELLSRFRTPTQVKKTLERLKNGEVDIVIGTHRLLQKDVKFKNLGLLIIDEEQRFGVTHKEKIKEMREHVDVLTLTATPIPRTLHMSLVGIRDMSIIEQPPKDRLPVSTYVLEYNFDVISEAITREVARGGQVYYLHNRVETIYRTRDRLAKISPNLRIAVGHGQMHERELEGIMNQLDNGEIDVLICTTIIETGLDIPNVNTIIIEDSDKMGLAQLYQLRGRVGRSNRMAYAYLTYTKNKVLNENASKRLKAISEFTEFGSGFKIALRDLEIRGAGNIIGAQQHGNMESIGYDLYCKILADSIAEIRGELMPKDEMVNVKLAVDAFIPTSYVEGENYRIELYKRFAEVRNENDADDLLAELKDRFGEPPNCVHNLLKIALITAECRKIGIIEISQRGNNIIISFGNDAKVNITQLLNWLRTPESSGVKLLPGDNIKICMLNDSAKVNIGKITFLLQILKNIAI
jgi:transcription-repair coupling factor (superfamily II helicase)